MTLLLRALAAGVILSLALIHISFEGVEKLLLVVSDFPVGNCCLVFGVLLMVFMENLSHHFMSTRQSVLHACGNHDESDNLEAAGQESQKDQQSKTSEIIPVAADGHTHSCVAANTAANCWASQSSQAQGVSIRDQISAYMFELGCVVHSILIGE